MPVIPRAMPPALASQKVQSVGNSGQSSPSRQPETTIPAQVAIGSNNVINNILYGQYPDEKLLEAMNSPKDRLFLLRLEKEVIEFVQNSKEPYVDLPPCNSFCRLLTHKLADYYHMTHSFEASTAGSGSVRIFRTPFCRVPPSLASIANANSATTPSPPVIMPKKIMRRGEEGAPGGSAGASKSTSEVGSDSKDKPGKEKMTREEREEAYNRAREKIFGTAEKNEDTTPEAGNAIDISRDSSVSAPQNRSSSTKKKFNRRTDNNEDFETRSHYAAFYGHSHQPWQPQYMPINMNNPPYNSNNPISHQQHRQQPQPMPTHTLMQSPPHLQQPPQPQHLQHPVTAQGFNNNPMVGGFVGDLNQQYPGMPGPMHASYNYHNYHMGNSMPPYNQPVSRQSSITGYPASGPPMPVGPQQTWQPPYHASSNTPYQRRPTVPGLAGPTEPMPAGPPVSIGIPYAYGQLPAYTNPNDPKSQHPIPGSYNRHAFNPQSQTFVPGNGDTMPVPQQNYNHGHGHVNSVSNVPFFNSFGIQQYGGAPGQYGMGRQMAAGGSQSPTVGTQPAAVSSSGQGNIFPGSSQLPNFGTTSTMPQRPPTNHSGA